MEIFTEYRAEIFKAFWTTVQLTVYSAVGALILGTVLVSIVAYRMMAAIGRLPEERRWSA